MSNHLDHPVSQKNRIKKKGTTKSERLKEVLIGLVDQYIKEGKPIGSNTLKESGFASLSSATIRNYFSELEEEGYLEQQHASGGRAPTSKGFQVYATEMSAFISSPSKTQKSIEELKELSDRQITSLLEKSAKVLAEVTHGAVSISAPRFDQDFIRDIKVLALDTGRTLCIVISDFGVIRTEVFHTDSTHTTHSLRRIESYFHWRLTGQDEPEMQDDEELVAAREWYNELVLRYIVSYAHFNEEEIYRTGFSHLLSYPEFSHASDVAKVLSLFENKTSLRHLLRDCQAHERLCFWIGDELIPYAPMKNTQEISCSFIAYPYFIHQTCVGSFGLLIPSRAPYKEIFSLMKYFSEILSEVLTRNVYKHKISYRQPHTPPPAIEMKEILLIENKKTTRLLGEQEQP